MTFAIDELVISYSSRKLLHSCPRKLEFRKFYNCGRRQDSLASGAGVCLHAGYQAYCIDGDIENAIYQMMLQFPIKYEKNPMGLRSIEACYATLMALINYHPMGEYELATMQVDGVNKPCIEVPFEIKIANFELDAEKHIPVSYIGYIDLILYNKYEDKYIPVDIKTHRHSMSDLSPHYQFDDQCIPYSFVVERMQQQAVTDIEFMYLPAFVDILEPHVAKYTFHKTADDVEEWARGLALDLQLIKMYYNMQWFPRNGGNACAAFNRACTYFDLCASRDSATIESVLALEDEQAPREFTPWISIDLELAGR